MISIEPSGEQVAEPDAPGSAPRASFHELYEDEWPKLTALGWSLTGSWSQAEELAQDAFTDAFRRWDEVGAMDRPGAWVRRALINRSASTWRTRGREAAGLQRFSARSGAEADRASTDRTGDLASERVDDPAFWSAVRSLPRQQATCVALHYLEDRSVADIADLIGASTSTVKVHLHRGRKALAARLRTIHDDLGEARS